VLLMLQAPSRATCALWQVPRVVPAVLQLHPQTVFMPGWQRLRHTLHLCCTGLSIKLRDCRNLGAGVEVEC
jgi:hypothetical protein